MASTSLTNTSLPACLEEPCAPCYIAGKTSWIEFPYHVVEQPFTLSVVPYVLEYPDGSVSTSYSTATLEQTSTTGVGGLDILDKFTWAVSGLTLTYPTTYAGLHNFSGKATDHWTSTTGETCSPANHTTSVALPATVNRASFIVPFNTASHKGPGAVPTQVLEYLDSLDMVQEQFYHIPLTSCLLAAPIAQPTLCTVNATSSITECSTQTSTYSDKHGAKTSTSVTCLTEVLTTEITKTNLRTDTSSITGETIKRKTAGSLTLVTGAPIFASATALAAQDSLSPSDGGQEQPAPSPSGGESQTPEQTAPAESPQPPEDTSGDLPSDGTAQVEPQTGVDGDVSSPSATADSQEPSATTPGFVPSTAAGSSAVVQDTPHEESNSIPGSGSGSRASSANAPIFAIDGQTLTAGGAATVGGSPIFALPDQGGVVIDGSQTVSLADGQATVVNQGGGPGSLQVSRSGSAIIVDGQTLSPDQEIRAGGTVVSLGRSTGVLFVDGIPTTLAGPSVTVGGSVYTAAGTESSGGGGLGGYIYSGVGGSSSAAPTETSQGGQSAGGSESSTGVATATGGGVRPRVERLLPFLAMSLAFILAG